ncbi:MAG: hypothetical protein ACOCX0_02870 [Bacteroidota bacterium]
MFLFVCWLQRQKLNVDL